MGADDPLRAVVLGYGFIGAMHVEAAAGLTDVEVVGVSGHRLDAARPSSPVDGESTA